MHHHDEACGPERLMQLVRAGDPRALEQITRCYGDRLLAAGRSHCRTGDEADDESGSPERRHSMKATSSIVKSHDIASFDVQFKPTSCFGSNFALSPHPVCFKSSHLNS